MFRAKLALIVLIAISLRAAPPGYVRGNKHTHAARVIIFVHGIFGDGIQTWTNPENNAYFPALVRDDPTFKDADIWVHDFPSPKRGRTYTIDELADHLRKYLNNDNVITNHQDVIFVAHSMGGLITRAYLLKNRDQLPAARVPMLYFYSTPTTGSEVANLARVFSNSPQLMDLRRLTSSTQSVLGVYESQWLSSPYRTIRTFCAYEVLRTHGVQIVDRTSATHLCTMPLDPIQRDHGTIVKPANNDKDESYVAFREAYRETFGLESSTPEPSTNVNTTGAPATTSTTSGADATNAGNATTGGTSATVVTAPLTQDALIEHIVEQLDVRSLLGQVLMVGFAAGKNHEDANERLAQLIKDYGIGNVILYDFNFPTQSSAAPGETASQIARLTARLQRAAYESQPPERKIPLLIAIDQEGGRDVRIIRDVTRMPNEIYLGVTRDPALAEQVGHAIGTELAALGINMNLAPVADINTKHVTDLIGRRAFSSRPDIAARLAVAWMCGLQAGGVLSVPKHYPGHGNASTDPHRAMTSMEYEGLHELQENDAIPFQAVAQAGADGIMTSHMITPLDNDLPVTISAKAIKYLRDDLHYEGLVITDDIVDMLGILMNKDGQPIRERHAVALQALRAGHDIVLFGCVSRYELKQDDRRTITRKEFDTIYTTLLRHLENHPEDQALLRASVRRILRAKARVAPLNGTLAQWTKPFDAEGFRSLVEQHTALARTVAASSAMLLTEQGRVITANRTAAHFRPGIGPLNKGELWREEDRILVVSPVTTCRDELYEALTARWIPKNQLLHHVLIHGWKDESTKLRLIQCWHRSAPEYSHVSSITGETTYDLKEAIEPEVDRIVAKAHDARLIIFGAFKHEHLRILDRVVPRLNDPAHEIIVLLFKEEPYFLPSVLYTQRNVTVLYLSLWPSTALAADFLFGDKQPLSASALPVSVQGIVDRPAGLPVTVTP
jgi:beta-glucosidase-like glycosyl hydrolase/pimeloyl-ACP methyl ester carboxylesterase